MKEQELIFCEAYEKIAKEFHFMELIKDNLTEKGRLIYQVKKEYLARHLHEYLTLTA